MNSPLNILFIYIRIFIYLRITGPGQYVVTFVFVVLCTIPFIGVENESQYMIHIENNLTGT